MVTKVIVVLICGVVIGLALYLLVRSLRKMAKGRCCEGCSGCSQAETCSSHEPSRQKEG